MGANNLSASCSYWWPSCGKRRVYYPQTFPRQCENPDFIVLHYPLNGQYVDWEDYPDSKAEASLHDPPPIQRQHEAPAKEQTELSHDSPKENESANSNKKSTPAIQIGNAQDQLSSSKPNPSSLPNEEFSAPQNSAQKNPAASDSSSEKTYTAGKAYEPKNNPKVFPAPPLTVGSPINVAITNSSSKLKSVEPLPAPSEKKTAQTNYTDPWLDFVAPGVRSQLFERFRTDREYREQIKTKIDQALQKEANLSPAMREKLDLYQRTLRELEDFEKNGGSEHITPMAASEAFSMNADETSREIQRFLSARDTEGSNDPLFERVHKALIRNIPVQKSRRAPASLPKP